MDDVEQIKRKIDVGDLIGSYIAVKRAGRNLKANCPFHNEKSPSFVISPERQIWHCFGCGKGGDIFTFIEEYERLDFAESLKLLAEKAGVKLTRSTFKRQEDNRKDKIYEINHLTSQFYNYLLTSHPTGKKALEYVKNKREVGEKLIETFSLGYAPYGNSLVKFLIQKKGYTKDELLNAGVAILRNGRLFDFFQNRLIFPILDTRGNIIAFSGRGLTDNAIPKYINTKETFVYIKGGSLFGIYQAKDSMKKEGKVLLMEGEFDVITSYKEGITNSVAVKGTALTENQIRLLKRFVQKIIFCFDTDSAGVEAQRRSISMIQKEGIAASVVIPPKGKDADELLRENPAEFKKALKNEENIYDYIINTASQTQDPDTAEGKKHILERTLPYLTEINNEIIKEHYLKKLSSLLDTSFESVVREAEKMKNPTRIEEKPTIKAVKKPRQEMIEEHLLTLALQSPKPKDAIAIIAGTMQEIEFGGKEINEIFNYLKKYFLTNDELNVAEISLNLPQNLTNTFDLCLLSLIPAHDSEETYLLEIEKLAREVKNLSLREKLKSLSQQIKIEEKKGESEELLKIQKEFDSLMTFIKN